MEWQQGRIQNIEGGGESDGKKSVSIILSLHSWSNSGASHSKFTMV